MYSLDVNFLNDRQDRPTEASLSRVRTVKSSPVPLYLGLVAMIALPALVGGFWLFLQNQNRQLAQEQMELDNQLTALNAQLSVINDINAQINRIDEENRALATVFDRIKPWSAVLQDVRGRVPSNVQIRQIEQVEIEPQPTATPTAEDGTATTPEPQPPSSAVRIIGYAQSFNDVNDFVLTLQRSPFLNAGTVRMVGSQLVNNPTQVEISGEQTDREIEVELPRVVEYTIEGDLTNLPASALLQDLERTLSVGLATRIQALRDRGVIQP
jgi:type IV pilus assembly protein PilN